MRDSVRWPEYVLCVTREAELKQVLDHYVSDHSRKTFLSPTLEEDVPG